MNDRTWPGRSDGGLDDGPENLRLVTVPAVVPLAVHAPRFVASVHVTAVWPAKEAGGLHVAEAATVTEIPEIVTVSELPTVSADVPVFLRVNDSELPALAMDIPVRVTLDWEAAAPIRLLIAVTTTPPAARTAAMMMNRSMLWEMALRFFDIFICPIAAPPI